jgi:hypothetical protein
MLKSALQKTLTLFVFLAREPKQTQLLLFCIPYQIIIKKCLLGAYLIVAWS